VEGETTVRMRRDTCVNLIFDMQSLLEESATYDGLKIPSTPSVKNLDHGRGKKLLHLQIRVLGATTRVTYNTLCQDCKARVGNKNDGLPLLDFHARSNILIPRRNGRSERVRVSFSFACYSKDRKPDLEYRWVGSLVNERAADIFPAWKSH
jgi:hypothetical protein